MSLPVNFQFYNAVTPRYIERIFLRLQLGEWHSTTQLKDWLRADGKNLEGSDTVTRNINAWSLAGLGETKTERLGRSSIKLFRLTILGKQLIDTYSTNQELFYDLMHFVFYSAWFRSKDVRRGQFWVYFKVCERLWMEAPASMDSFELTNRLQAECRQLFPEYEPTFPVQSVRAVFPWLGALVPPFLSKCGTKSQLCSTRRSYCTPQLFHLATDLVYKANDLRYGTSMALDDQNIAAICKVCLLDIERFWSMTDLTHKSIKGYDIRKGQWNISIALEGPPNWIELPDFTRQEDVQLDEIGEGMAE